MNTSAETLGYRFGSAMRQTIVSVAANPLASILIAVAITAVWMFRHDYIPRNAGGQGTYIVRINRVTGHTCYIVEATQIAKTIGDMLTFPECK
jgi:hypothetical protein